MNITIEQLSLKEQNPETHTLEYVKSYGGVYQCLGGNQKDFFLSLGSGTGVLYFIPDENNLEVLENKVWADDKFIKVNKKFKITIET